MSTRKVASKSRTVATTDSSVSLEASFAEVVSLIEQARQRAYQAVNTELVGLYWQIGQYISEKLAAAEWGDGVVESLAQHLAREISGLRGFSAQNLWRMRQLFDTYRGDEKLSSNASSTCAWLRSSAGVSVNSSVSFAWLHSKARS
jgi:hypothetical protein